MNTQKSVFKEGNIQTIKQRTIKEEEEGNRVLDLPHVISQNNFKKTDNAKKGKTNMKLKN